MSDTIMIDETNNSVIIEETSETVIVQAPVRLTAGYWGTFWDTTDQSAANTTTAYAVTLNSADANSDGVSVASNSQITFANAGVYNIQFSIQFENTDSQDHDVDVWFRKNGTDIADSNSRVTVPSKHGSVNGHVLVALNLVLQLAANDYVQIMWATDDTAVRIETIPAASTPTRPRTPSVIVTATTV